MSMVSCSGEKCSLYMEILFSFLPVFDLLPTGGSGAGTLLDSGSFPELRDHAVLFLDFDV